MNSQGIVLICIRPEVKRMRARFLYGDTTLHSITNIKTDTLCFHAQQTIEYTIQPMFNYELF